MRTYIYCQPPAGGRIRSKVIKCSAYGVAIMNGRRDGRGVGFEFARGMGEEEGCKGEVKVYEAYEVKRKEKFLLSFTSPDLFFEKNSVVKCLLTKKRKKSPVFTTSA